jgi:hypothetical protein
MKDCAYKLPRILIRIINDQIGMPFVEMNNSDFIDQLSGGVIRLASGVFVV